MIALTMSVIWLLAALTGSTAWGRSTTEICADPNIASKCFASCAPACADANFLSEHADYCLDNELIGVAGSRKKPRDAPGCVAFFVQSPTSLRPDPVKLRASGQDCSKMKKLSERLRCEQEGQSPGCTRTVRDLEGTADLLVVEIESELSTFGDLLKRDWRDVSNRRALCGFSLDELDKNYETATQNPKILKALQSRATVVQDCQSEWEQYVSTRWGTEASKQREAQGSQAREAIASERLPDNLVRDMRQQLETLKPGIEKLTKSMMTLKNAAETITSVARLHLLFCDPKGEKKRPR